MIIAFGYNGKNVENIGLHDFILEDLSHFESIAVDTSPLTEYNYDWTEITVQKFANLFFHKESVTIDSKQLTLFLNSRVYAEMSWGTPPQRISEQWEVMKRRFFSVTLGLIQPEAVKPTQEKPSDSTCPMIHWQQDVTYEVSLKDAKIKVSFWNPSTAVFKVPGGQQ